MSQQSFGVHTEIFVSIMRFLCLDPITGPPSKTYTWSMHSKPYVIRMAFLSLFFTILSVKMAYGLLVSSNFGFQNCVLAGCSILGMFFTVSQMFISSIKGKHFRKVVKNLLDLWSKNYYSIHFNFVNKICIVEICVLLVTIIGVSILDLMYYELLIEGISFCALDLYIEITMFVTCFNYFNTAFNLKKCFSEIYERSKDITNHKKLKQLWIEYLRLHSVVEKVKTTLF